MEIYKGLDIFYTDYSADETGYYASDFSKPKQPTTILYPTKEALKKAIDRGKIKWNK